MNMLEKAVRVALEELAWDPRKVAVHTLSSAFPQHGFNRLRTRLLIRAGVPFGPGAAIAGPLRITGHGAIWELLSIGPGSFISGQLHIDLGAHVRIGARVCIGDDVKLLTVTHELGQSHQRCDRLRCAPIDIGDGTWIGSRVTIMPGVRVGRGAVVGAGAVVTGDVAPNTLFAGVPARFIRDLDTGDEVVEEGPSSSARMRSAPPGQQAAQLNHGAPRPPGARYEVLNARRHRSGENSENRDMGHAGERNGIAPRR
jgi:maltose O-acetyltransferase